MITWHLKQITFLSKKKNKLVSLTLSTTRCRLVYRTSRIYDLLLVESACDVTLGFISSKSSDISLALPLSLATVAVKRTFVVQHVSRRSSFLCQRFHCWRCSRCSVQNRRSSNWTCEVAPPGSTCVETDLCWQAI